MADTIRPWLAEYLIGIGEQFGGNLSNAPRHEKQKKVQLIEFLTYAVASQDDCLWAKISDKHYKIPVRFSRTAMSEYTSRNSRRLTEHKTAIVSVKNFKPFFSRVPLSHRNGMSEKACLALEIDHVSIIGSIGEGQWGNPQDVETNDDLRQWSEGLRQHGGSCNVLMEKKRQRDANIEHNSPPPQNKKRDPLPVAPKKGKGTHVAFNASVSKPVPEKVDLLKEYERSWRPISGNPAVYGSKPKTAKGQASKASDGPSAGPASSRNTTSVNLAPQRAPSMNNSERRPGPARRDGFNVLDLSSSPPLSGLPPSHPTPLPEREQQTTPAPEEWPESRRVSPHFIISSQDEVSRDRKKEPTTHLAENLKVEDDIEIPNTFPTPAQRPRPYMQDAFPSPPASLSPVHPSPSPLPPASTPMPTPDSSPTAQLRARAQIVRKVPYPAPPPPPSSGLPRILAPNSDSGTQPQSQSQLPSNTQWTAETPCLTQESALDDKGDKSNVQSYLFTQPDDYDGDQSMLEQESEVVDNSCFDGLFTQLPGDDIGVSVTATTDRTRDSTARDEESNEAQTDGYCGDISSAHGTSDSVVPDSQGDELDDDDAQVAESLFGQTQSYMVDISTEAIEPSSVVEASVPVEFPSFAGGHHKADGHQSPSQRQDRLSKLSVQQSTVREHDPDTWEIPTFMRDTNGKNKGKQKEVSEPKNIVARSTRSSISNGDTRFTKEKTSIGERSRRQSTTSVNNHAVPGPSRTVNSIATRPAPSPLGRAGAAVTVNVPKIDLRSVPRTSRKRSRLSYSPFDLEGSDEGSVRKKRRTWDSSGTVFRRSGTGRHNGLDFDGPKGDKEAAVEDSGVTVSVEARMKLKDFARNTGFGKFRPNMPSSANYNPDEPAWMSWPLVNDILLQTGRYRDEQLKQQPAGDVRKSS